MLFVWPTVEISTDEVTEVAKRLVPLTNGLGIEQVLVQGRVTDPSSGETADVVFRLGYQAGRGLTMTVTDPPTAPMQPLDAYTHKVLACRRRGTAYPYETVPMLPTEAEDGEDHFTELDLVGDRLAPVDRPPGPNAGGV